MLKSREILEPPFLPALAVGQSHRSTPLISKLIRDGSGRGVNHAEYRIHVPETTEIVDAGETVGQPVKLVSGCVWHARAFRSDGWQRNLVSCQSDEFVPMVQQPTFIHTAIRSQLRHALVAGREAALESWISQESNEVEVCVEEVMQHAT